MALGRRSMRTEGRCGAAEWPSTDGSTAASYPRRVARQQLQVTIQGCVHAQSSASPAQLYHTDNGTSRLGHTALFLNLAYVASLLRRQRNNRASNMSPDRGAFTPPSPDHGQSDTVDDDGLHRTLPPGRSFTVRGVLVGLVVGLVICFSNMYFGLQTGWVSTMTMPASLMGFGIFKALRPHLRFPFSPVENVLVQTVAGSMAIMPLGCGFVGVVRFDPHSLVEGAFGTWIRLADD